mmetsp:Transcript_114316/g.160420  ORF Transcript_114316/g.160420 Transcript_114316/m.160420 type:complete len:241 (-) Transcript_114316:107-829(-)
MNSGAILCQSLLGFLGKLLSLLCAEARRSKDLRQLFFHFLFCHLCNLQASGKILALTTQQLLSPSHEHCRLFLCFLVGVLLPQILHVLHEFCCTFFQLLRILMFKRCLSLLCKLLCIILQLFSSWRRCGFLGPTNGILQATTDLRWNLNMQSSWMTLGPRTHPRNFPHGKGWALHGLHRKQTSTVLWLLRHWQVAQLRQFLVPSLMLHPCLVTPLHFPFNEVAFPLQVVLTSGLTSDKSK